MYYKDDDNWRTDLDINAWKNEIVSNVQSWLTSDANSAAYTSAYKAFENANGIDISGLVNCYNVDYTALNLG